MKVFVNMILIWIMLFFIWLLFLYENKESILLFRY